MKHVIISKVGNDYKKYIAAKGYKIKDILTNKEYSEIVVKKFDNYEIVNI